MPTDKDVRNATHAHINSSQNSTNYSQFARATIHVTMFNNTSSSSSSNDKHSTPHYFWYTLDQHDNIGQYYRTPGGYLCPDCKVITPSLEQFKEQHRNASQFTSSKKTLARSINIAASPATQQQQHSSTIMSGMLHFLFITCYTCNTIFTVITIFRRQRFTIIATTS